MSLTRRADVPPADRPLLDFALGKALEDAGEHRRALEVFARGNRSVRSRSPWDAAGFARRVAEIGAAFLDAPVASAAAQGHEVVFIIGMPRSGSTLGAQVLAAHSQVEGASELPYLPQVIEQAHGAGRIGYVITDWAEGGGLKFPARLQNIGLATEVIEFDGIKLGEPDDTRYEVMVR